MKDVRYIVAKSPLTNTIFAGTLYEDKKKKGFTTWRTRCDVTKQAVNAVMEYYVGIFEEEKPKKGLIWNFGKEGDDFTIELTIKRKPKNGR